MWEMKLEPGEYHPLHERELDQYLVIMSGDLLVGVASKGSGQG